MPINVNTTAGGRNFKGNSAVAVNTAQGGATFKNARRVWIKTDEFFDDDLGVIRPIWKIAQDFEPPQVAPPLNPSFGHNWLEVTVLNEGHPTNEKSGYRFRFGAIPEGGGGGPGQDLYRSYQREIWIYARTRGGSGGEVTTCSANPNGSGEPQPGYPSFGTGPHFIITNPAQTQSPANTGNPATDFHAWDYPSQPNTLGYCITARMRYVNAAGSGPWTTFANPVAVFGPSII